MKADTRYIPFLDGFRGYAILLVLVGHLNKELIKTAQLGVTLFFFVSGFLITKLLISEYNKEKTIHLKEFYLRRIFRLYPALIFFLILTCVQISILGYKIIWPDIFAGLFYFTNYYLVYFAPVLPDVHYPLASKILWSLSVEEHFYLFFPFLFLWVYKENSKSLLYLLGFLVVVFLGVRFVEFGTATNLADVRKEIYYTTHCRADSILYGCLSALLIYAIPSKKYLAILQSKATFWIALVALLAVQVVTTELYHNTIKYSLTAICFAFCIPAFLFFNTQTWISRIATNSVIVFIGRVSYSIYLFHWVALTTVSFYVTERTVLWYGLIIAATFLLSLISFYWVERPFLSLRRKFGSNAK